VPLCGLLKESNLYFACDNEPDSDKQSDNWFLSISPSLLIILQKKNTLSGSHLFEKVFKKKHMVCAKPQHEGEN
jgi:hypothetical protein